MDAGNRTTPAIKSTTHKFAMKKFVQVRRRWLRDRMTSTNTFEVILTAPVRINTTEKHVEITVCDARVWSLSPSLVSFCSMTNETENFYVARLSCFVAFAVLKFKFT